MREAIAIIAAIATTAPEPKRDSRSGCKNYLRLVSYDIRHSKAMGILESEAFSELTQYSRSQVRRESS
jgi:hypothetical protein